MGKLISACCGAYIPANGNDAGEDYGICPECKEWTEFVDEEEDPDEFVIKEEKGRNEITDGFMSREEYNKFYK